MYPYYPINPPIGPVYVWHGNYPSVKLLPVVTNFESTQLS